MDKKHYVCCSFGKDSIATIILAHENNEPLDGILYSEVMFDDITSGELPEHIDFIKNKAIPKFQEWGYETIILHSKDTYIDLFYKTVKRSKIHERNGKYRGFPMSPGCHVNSVGKIQPMRQYIAKQKGEVVQYVGIACDEKTRLDRLHNKKNRVSLLEKYSYTEKMAFELCRKYDLLSPIYEHSSRGGCWFCPNAKYSELKNIRNNHNNLWNKLLELNKEECANPYFNTWKKERISDIEERFLEEEKQISVFDYMEGT